MGRMLYRQQPLNQRHHPKDRGKENVGKNNVVDESLALILQRLPGNTNRRFH